MFYGALVALRAKELKRMFAFTSLNHMGFVIFGAFATVASGSLLGMEGAIFQMFVHAFTAGSLFMLAGYIQQQAGTSEISRLKGLRNVMPRTAGLLVVASAAAMALPPFASFLAELLVIAGGIAASSVHRGRGPSPRPHRRLPPLDDQAGGPLAAGARVRVVVRDMPMVRRRRARAVLRPPAHPDRLLLPDPGSPPLPSPSGWSTSWGVQGWFERRWT